MICVLVVASGAEWESSAVSLLGAEPGLLVLKRCVDVDDLLAAASAGQAQAAVVALDAPGFDGVVVELLRRHRVLPVAVVAGGPAALDQGRMRAHRIGVTSVVGADDLAALPAALQDVGGSADTVVRPSMGPDLVHPGGPDADQPPAPEGGGRVIAVWGPAGAPGRTLVATALAAELARRAAPTVLVDADPYGGTVAQQLGILDEVSGMLSAARLAGTGLLAERLPSVTRALGPHLRVVTGLPRPDRWIEVRGGVVEHLLEAWRPRAHVVVDTGFSLEDDPGSDYGVRPGRNTMTLGALAVADEVVVVGSADPVGLSRLARGLVDLRDVVSGAPVRVVVNRNRATLGWSEQDIAGMVSGFARTTGMHFLPEDRAGVDRALVSGRALVEHGDSSLVRAVAGLATALVGDPGPGGRASRARVRRRRAGRALRR